jgi:hypothetical protein
MTQSRRASALEAGETDPVITVCQGPPRCDLKGDDAVAAMESGCPWCERITVHKDGSETTTKPGLA